jgi:hypothetical protein
MGSLYPLLVLFCVAAKQSGSINEKVLTRVSGLCKRHANSKEYEKSDCFSGKIS